MIPILSVSDFLSQINDIIAGEFIVEGEVSQYKTSNGKWVYFDLKDAQSVLNCFASAYNFRTPLEDGMKVRILGYPNIYSRYGKFSFVVQKVELVGDGTLKRAYELLKKKLEAEGIFNLERKRALPKFPAKIGVIASKESAAFGDFKKIINNRWSGVEITLRNVLVQGPQAVTDIVEAFRDFDTLPEKSRPEVIALIRGGGSMEDLAAFNSEEVVRAIYNSRIPVITGIGHERDITLAELVADVRASTPSNVAEMIVPEKRDFISSLDFELDNIASALNFKLSKLKHMVDQVLLAQILDANVKTRKDNVLFAERLLKNSNPRNLLAKGYSITRNKAGVIVRRLAQVEIEEEIMVELGEGKIMSKVNKKLK